MAATTARVALARATGGGWLLHPLDDAGAPAGPVERLPDASALASAVARVEEQSHPRWVWRATSAGYPALVTAGARVNRCHDVAHTEALLLGHEGRWSELAGLAGGGEDRGEPTLLDEPAPDDATLLAEHAD
ncbi:MAG: hypothetical protein WAL50_15540, partial [Kineosporiaceae bacterium]